MIKNNETTSYKQNLKTLIQQLTEMIPEEKFSIFNHDAENLGATHTSPVKLNINDTAPDFSLPNAYGKYIQLHELLKTGPVVLTFYRGIWCPYCNLHLQLLQKILPHIKKSGASLLAVSPMKPDNSLDMLKTNELEFEVLTDIDNSIASQFTKVFKNAEKSINTMTELGYDFYSFYDNKSAELPVPATFIIDSNHKVVFSESEGGDYRLRTEPELILNALDSITH